MSLTKFFSLFFLLFILLSACSSGKKIRAEVNQISNEEQIEQLKQQHPDWKIKIIKVNENNLKEKRLYRNKDFSKISQTGEQQESILYKLISTDSVKRFRVSYIYLDGKKLSKPAIDSLRTRIIQQFNEGVPFAELAAQYSMDGNRSNGGDLGWFVEKEMVPEFENAVKQHQKGDIFTLDIPERNWYYVVYKTYDDSQSINYILLRVIIPE